MAEQLELGWLIRDTSNKIRGPFRQIEIVQMIKKGQLKPKTELARANSYWFSVEEKTELARFLPDFNGGKPVPEQPTQMTATLTQADVQEHGVEITTLTSLPPKEEQANKDQSTENASEGVISSNSGQIEWLSDEFADDFGQDFGNTISIQTDVSSLKATPAASPEETNKNLEIQQPTPTKDSAKEDILKRATVKADTLPSELKNFQGDRPKPIDTLIKSPVKQSSSALAPALQSTVNVPLEPEPAPKMFNDEDDSKVLERRGKRNITLFAVVATFFVVVGGVYLLLPKSRSVGNSTISRSSPSKKGLDAFTTARNAILLFDLEGAKGALSDLESELASKSEASTYLAQALVKKEFLFDVEGAMVALQAARAQVRNRRTEAEVDNLMGVYGFEHDSASSIEMFQRNLGNYKDDPVFLYNLALAQLRSKKSAEAIDLLDHLLGSDVADNTLIEDAALAQAWAIESVCGSGGRDPLCKRSADAEDAYLRALTINPNSPKARLGLALFRLRRGGIKASENDFKAFLDLAPELDPPTHLMNFRKMGNSDFYGFAHSQIVELNTPSPNLNKPSALIMAADAIISGMQGGTSEASKILDVALSSAPGDVNVLKAFGYLRWKEGQLPDLVDALKDLRDRNSFALNLMLGKAYMKLRKRDLAEKYFRNLADGFPNRSEGHALLGELFLDLERQDAAKAEFLLALKKDPLDLVARRGLLKSGGTPLRVPEIESYLPF